MKLWSVTISHRRYMYNAEEMTMKVAPYEIPKVYGFNTDETVNTGPVQDEPHREESVESGVYITVK